MTANLSASICSLNPSAPLFCSDRSSPPVVSGIPRTPVALELRHGKDWTGRLPMLIQPDPRASARIIRTVQNPAVGNVKGARCSILTTRVSRTELTHRWLTDIKDVGYLHQPSSAGSGCRRGGSACSRRSLLFCLLCGYWGLAPLSLQVDSSTSWWRWPSSCS